MKLVSFRHVFVVGGLAALVIIYAVLWLRMIESPAERTGADFIPMRLHHICIITI